MESNLLNKDKIWSRIKNYVYFVVFLIILLITFSIATVILNCIIYSKLKHITIPYTST